MPTRFLSDEQRRRYGRYAADPNPEQLARYFHLDAADHEVIARLRGDQNRLGFALQLGTIRFLGAWPSDFATIPKVVVTTVAGQLGLENAVDLETYSATVTRRRHMALIREVYGFRDLADDPNAAFRLIRWLYTLCWSGDDRPSLLIDRATTWMLARKILLPGISTLERLVARIRDRAHQRLWRHLLSALSEDQRKRINALLEGEEDGDFKTLDALRAAPTKRMYTQFMRHLKRIDDIRTYNLTPAAPAAVPNTLILRLASIARTMRPSAIAAMKEPRRTALVAALYFKNGRGITLYNLVSDQFTGLNALVVPGTLRDSMFILALLLEQQTDLEPVEIMTDTAAYSDIVFGLFWLLGYQFSPRLADIGKAQLWRIDREADYGPVNVLAKGKINLKLITENWEDLLRLAGSLKLGHIQAGSIMRTLQVKERPTTLAKALAELGRIVKSLHILSIIDDKDKRRRILIQLNRQEFRHKLARKVCYGDQGQITKPYRQGQEEQLGALGFTLNVVAYWNALYMQAVLDQLESEGKSINPTDIARISPLAHKHLNFLGRHAFGLPEDVAAGKLRPLRQPTYE